MFLKVHGGHIVLSAIVKIVTLPFIILADNTKGFYKLNYISGEPTPWVVLFQAYIYLGGV